MTTAHSLSVNVGMLSPRSSAQDFGKCPRSVGISNSLLLCQSDRTDRIGVLVRSQH